MPVALLPVYALAQQALRRGRTTFTPAERARLELARCRGFLLGLPQELLANTPQSVVDIMLTRFATLRKGFDETCAGLVAATMAADLTPDRSLSSRIDAWMERGLSKLFFVTRSMRGDKHAAAGVGVRLSLADYLGAAAATILITSTMTAYAIAARIPVLSRLADRSLVHKLTRHWHVMVTLSSRRMRTHTVLRTLQHTRNHVMRKNFPLIAAVLLHKPVRLAHRSNNLSTGCSPTLFGSPRRAAHSSSTVRRPQPKF